MAHAGRFIGRARDFARLAELEAQGERLVTVTGAAGMGKTRLSREYARRREEEKTVFFVDLTSARSLEDAGVAIADAFALSNTQLGEPREILLEAARVLGDRRPALVLLDNFEQIVDCAIPILEPLLAVPGVDVLVTSRERLRVSGEVVLDLSPLTLPSDDADEKSEALELLLDRCRRAAGAEIDFDVPTCVEIVRALDGIPLALELAAPRIALLGPVAFRALLDRPLDILTHAQRDAARHQQSLRDAIDGSWNLLDADERAALAACSVFRSSFGLDAFESVIAVEPPRAAMEILQSLYDKSLVRRLTTGAQSARFSLYVSIREYAAEKLSQDRDALAIARQRHASFHLEHGRALADDVNTSRAAEVLDALSAERDELLAVVERSLEEAGSALERASHALLVLGPLYLARGPIPPFLVLLSRVLESVERHTLAPGLVAELHDLQGRCLHSRGEFEASADAHRAALAIAKEHALPELEASAFDGLTASLSRRNPSEDVLTMFTEAAALHRSLGDIRNEGVALRRASISLRELGRLDEAREVATRSLALLREAGDAVYEALALAEIAYIALEAGDLALARAKAEHANRLAALTGNWINRALLTGLLSLVALAEGSLEESTALVSAVLPERSRQVGAARYEGQVRGYLGVAWLELGDVPRACEELEAAVALLEGENEQRYRRPIQAFLGAAYAAQGNYERAEHQLREATTNLDPSDHRQHAVAVLVEVVALSRAARTGPVAPSLPIAARACRTLAATSHHTALGKAAFDLRLALRYARRQLAAWGLAADDAAAKARAVTLGAEADWFEVEDGQRSSLRRRPTLRALMLELVRARHEAPGQPVDPSRLFAAGWPNERIAPQAARNRLAVSLSTLRKLGLRELLVADARGYFLDPTVAFTWTDAEPQV